MLLQNEDLAYVVPQGPFQTRRIRSSGRCVCRPPSSSNARCFWDSRSTSVSSKIEIASSLITGFCRSLFIPDSRSLVSLGEGAWTSFLCATVCIRCRASVTRACQARRTAMETKHLTATTDLWTDVWRRSLVILVTKAFCPLQSPGTAD